MTQSLMPLTPCRLAWANLGGKPARTLFLLAIVATFTLIFFTGSMFVANWQTGLESLSARLGADMLVVPQGQGKKIENVLLRAEPSTFYIDQSMVDVVKKVPGAAAVTPQLFISSMDAQCCSVKVQLIGMDWDSDFVVKPWLKGKLDRPLKDNEIIVGNYIVGGVGAKLKFFDQEFTIVAELAPSGMGFDSSIFMTMAAARALGEKKDPDEAKAIAQSVSAVLVRVTPGTDPLHISDGVLDQLGLGANVNFVFASAMMSDTAAKLRQLLNAMLTVGGVLWLAALAILFTVFSFAFNERALERATLRAMGASPTFVANVVMLESFFVGVAGSLVGIGLGAVLFTLFTDNLAKVVGLPSLAAPLSLWLMNGAGTFGLGLLTPVIASRVILRRRAHDDIYQTLKEG